MIHTGGFFLAFETSVLESRIFYTVEEEDVNALDDWLKVPCRLVLREVPCFS